MTGQILDISTNGLSFHLDRGFVAVREKGKTLAKVPIADVDSLIVSAQGAMWSTRLVSALVAQGSTAVFVDEYFAPSMLMVPCNGHHAQGGRMRCQARASKPVCKRLWAQLVKAKIQGQAAALERQGKPCERLLRLAKEVRSGDPDNREAVAAQYYWRSFFGDDFRRNRTLNGANAMLNYGYAVVRSAAARGIVAAGLHPSLSVHHVSDHDAYCLADDLMEPFRPAVDLMVSSLIEQEVDMANATTRVALVGVLNADYLTANGHTPMSVALVKLAQSLAGVFEGKCNKLEMPISCLPVAGVEG